MQDLSYLLPSLEQESPALRGDKWKGLNSAVTQLVKSFGLVRFEVLAVENKKSMTHLLRVLDRANGYVFGSAEGANDTVWQVAMRNEPSMLEVQDIQERWIDHKDEYDELERKQREEHASVLEATDAPPADDAADDLPVPVSDVGVKVVRKKK